MKIVLAPAGTDGDVRPLVALGLALRARGHGVTLAAAQNFGEMALAAGLHFVSVGPGVRNAPQGFTGGRLVERLGRQSLDGMAELDAACDGADAIVGSMIQLAAPTLAAARRLPYFYAVLQPVLLASRTHCIANPFAFDYPAWLNAGFYRLWPLAWNHLFRRSLNEARARRGQAAVDDAHHHMTRSGHLLLTFEEALAPVPPDLHAEATASGAWSDSGAVAAGSAPEQQAALDDFLARGDPPVYVGFGSAWYGDAARLSERVIGAVRDAGYRVVIGPGWGGLGVRQAGDDVHIAGPVSHDALFPRCAVVVHHGGAGTTTTAARAGVAQVIVPHWGDQFDWARRVHRLGLGPAPIARAWLSRRALAGRLIELREQARYAAAAAAFTRKLSPPGRILHAVVAIEAGAGHDVPVAPGSKAG